MAHKAYQVISTGGNGLSGRLQAIIDVDSPPQYRNLNTRKHDSRNFYRRIAHPSAHPMTHRDEELAGRVSADLSHGRAVIGRGKSLGPTDLMTE
eukprot:scaffold294010_cov18-Prasinocladus_malaysianus.AAC.1